MQTEGNESVYIAKCLDLSNKFEENLFLLERPKEISLAAVDRAGGGSCQNQGNQAERGLFCLKILTSEGKEIHFDITNNKDNILVLEYHKNE